MMTWRLTLPTPFLLTNSPHSPPSRLPSVPTTTADSVPRPKTAFAVSRKNSTRASRQWIHHVPPTTQFCLLMPPRPVFSKRRPKLRDLVPATCVSPTRKRQGNAESLLKRPNSPLAPPWPPYRCPAAKPASLLPPPPQEPTTNEPHAPTFSNSQSRETSNWGRRITRGSRMFIRTVGVTEGWSIRPPWKWMRRMPLMLWPRFRGRTPGLGLSVSLVDKSAHAFMMNVYSRRGAIVFFLFLFLLVGVRKRWCC